MCGVTQLQLTQWGRQRRRGPRGITFPKMPLWSSWSSPRGLPPLAGAIVLSLPWWLRLAILWGCRVAGVQSGDTITGSPLSEGSAKWLNCPFICMLVDKLLSINIGSKLTFRTSLALHYLMRICLCHVHVSIFSTLSLSIHAHEFVALIFVFSFRVNYIYTL